MTTQELAKRIKAKAKQRGMKMSQVFRAAKVTRSTFTRGENGKTKGWNSVTVQRLLDVVGPLEDEVNGHNTAEIRD